MWDIAIDLETGDWLFEGKRDLQQVTGDALVLQRIHTRLKIRRGTFIYDRSGSLGSHLYDLLRQGIPAARNTLEQMIRDALAPMNDIQVVDISLTFPTDPGPGIPNQVIARINYKTLQPEVSPLPTQITGSGNVVQVPIAFTGG